MKVLIFISSLSNKDGGPSRSVPVLAKGLSENDVDVSLMTFETADMNTHAVQETNVKLVLLRDGISSSELEATILDGHYNLIHLQTIWHPIYHKVVKIALKHNITYMTTPRGMLEPWAYSGQGWLKYLKKKIAMVLYQKYDMDRSSCILATSDMERDNLRKLEFKAPIAVIPNGIVIDDYPCRKNDKGVENQVIFLSRIHPKKGIELLINAWDKIRYSYPEWNVIIVGNGDNEYIASLAGIIQSKNLENYIRILPPAFGYDKYLLYSKSAIFCLPTYSENFGMVIAEALSCGLPVITTKGAPWEILQTSNSGWWIEPTVKDLENALCDALSRDKKELFAMGQRGADMVRENFSYIEVAKKLKAVYEWTLNEGEKPVFVNTVL